MLDREDHDEESITKDSPASDLRPRTSDFSPLTIRLRSWSLRS